VHRQYLNTPNLRSEHPLQHKQSVVNTLLDRAKKLSSTTQGLNSELKYVKRTLLFNGYPKWMIKDKKKKQYNRPPEFRSKVVLPYSADLGETLKSILERHRIRTIFKPVIKLSTTLALGKDAVPANKRRDVVYEIPCGNCEHMYIGETKRSLSTRLKEHHRDTFPRNILENPEKTALTKPAAQSGHAFNWDYAHVLHHVNSYHKRIVLESLYINLKTNTVTVNDKSANFPAIYYNVLKHERSLSVTGLP